MTSTPFNIGIAEGKRPASRVLYPPGGKHSDIFGVDPDPPRYGRRQGFQVQGIDIVVCKTWWTYNNTNKLPLLVY